WEQRKLGDLALSLEYGVNAASRDFDGKHAYLRITDIDDDTHQFIAENATTPDTDFNTLSHYRLQNGDLLFARTGASVGKTYLYRPSDGEMYFAGFLIRARLHPSVDSTFVFQSTLNQQYKKYVEITSQRSGQPGVNSQEYACYALKIPSLNEQHRIGVFLNKLDSLITLHQR
ncbi:restriction endonuclease subunit S, partial [Bifidobacterium cuniculi]